MKRALCNVYIGEQKPHWDKCIHTQNLYCKKYNIDHYIAKIPVNWIENFYTTSITTYKDSVNLPCIDYKIKYGTKNYDQSKAYFEKYQCLTLFNRGYDQVLYLDNDILVTPNAKNIFNTYSDTNKFYAYDESNNCNREKYIDAIIKNNHDITWRKNLLSNYEYYNAGVQLYGKHAIDHIANYKKFSSIHNLQNMYDFGDQNYINTLLQKFDVNTESISFDYNRMSFRDRDLNNERYKANFIHYAGPCIYGLTDEAYLSTSGKWRPTEGTKRNIMHIDYKTLYE